jgi:hypothetical protein
MAMLLPTLFLCIAPCSALAKEAATWEGEVYGVPVWITVVPRGHTISNDVRRDEPWWKWGNTTSDVYLFSFINQDRLRLILEFAQNPDGQPEARIYVSDLGRADLEYEFRGDQLRVLNDDGHPYMTLRPTKGAWVVDGKTNYNLELLIDGILPGGGYSQAQTDGEIDWVQRIGGKPGEADWQTLRLIDDPKPTWGYSRFSASLRMPDSPPYKVAKPFMPSFPYLGLGLGMPEPNQPDVSTSKGYVDWFVENPLPLYYNLRFQEFQLFGFTGFQNAGQYYYNSTTAPPDVNFESPFVFYSFDQASRYPHLLVRGGYYGVEDPHAPPSRVDRSTFRYSWKMTNGKPWDYSLDVAGTYVYSQSITIGDEQLVGVPPKEAPEWVMSKTWPVVTFVEAVGSYGSSEGIYFYTAQSNSNWWWLDGTYRDVPSYFEAPYLQPDLRVTKYSDEALPENFRGEYSATYFRKPTTYFSPIDNRVHLQYAQGGVWNLGDNQVLRVKNLNGDAYIDAWIREQTLQQQPNPNDPNEPPRALPGKTEEALYVLGEYLIYSGPNGSQLRKLNAAPASLEMAPPKDKAGWQAFRDEIGPLREQGRDPSNLRGWLPAIGGPALLSTHGQMRDVRVTEDGFRFIVDLQPGFQYRNIGGKRDLKSGSYAVFYEQGRFTMQPLTPPALSATLFPSEFRHLTAGALQVALRNDGLQDVRDATLELWTASPRGERTLALSATVDLLAGLPVTTTLNWAPAAAGDWTLTPSIREADGGTTAFAPVKVTVLPTRAAPTGEVVSKSTSIPVAPFALLGLVAFAAVAAMVVWRHWHTFPQEGVHDTV